MEAYSVIKENKLKKIGRKKIHLDGYCMNLHLKKIHHLIEVKEIMIFNESLKKNVIQRQFNIAYKRLFKMVMELCQDDEDSSGNTEILLSEVERMKAILKDKYQQEISNKEYFNMMKKACLLETELQNRLVLLASYQQEKQRGMGR